MTAVDGLHICARRRDLPWFIGNQLTLLIRQEGRADPRRIAPDIIVYPSAARRRSDVARDGAAWSANPGARSRQPGTALDSDINLFDPDGKPQLYARIGVEEYLVFDPTGRYCAAGGLGATSRAGGFVPWLPEADGRWHSTLGVSFAPQGPLLRVYDHDGRLVPLTTEFDAMLTARERDLAERERESPSATAPRRTGGRVAPPAWRVRT